MKKKLAILALSLCMSCSLIACGDTSASSDSSTESTKEEEKVYIEESDLQALFTNPDDFKGKYVKLTGQIFTEPEVQGGETALQVYADPENVSNNFIVKYTGGNTFASQDYVSIDGKIAGTFTGENMLGATLEVPLIESDSVEPMSYIDAVVPTITEFTPENAAAEQTGINIKVDKIEYAETETRIYMTVTNNSSDNFNFSSYSTKLIQNGQQIDLDSASMTSYYAELPEFSDSILPGIASSGVLVFPAMDSSASFQVYAEGYSDNWDISLEPFIIDVTIQ